MSVEKVDISVVICCHNSQDRIARTLSSLSRVRVPGNRRMEILIVDNNCTDSTRDRATETWRRLSQTIDIRVVSESTPGQAAARKCGVYNAFGETIVFCDDDNCLDSNYLEIALPLLEGDPSVAIVAGNGFFPNESRLNSFQRDCLKFLACRPQSTRQEKLAARGFYTAGLVARRSALLEVYDRFQFSLEGRIGERNLAGGEDIEICLLMAIRGYSAIASPALRFQHLIEARRLRPAYLRMLRFQIGVANGMLAPCKLVAKRNEQSIRSNVWILIAAAMCRSFLYAAKMLVRKSAGLDVLYEMGRIRGYLTVAGNWPEIIHNLRSQRVD